MTLRVMCPSCKAVQQLTSDAAPITSLILCAKCAMTVSEPQNFGTACFVCRLLIEPGRTPHRFGVHPQCEDALRAGQSEFISQHNKKLDAIYSALADGDIR